MISSPAILNRTFNSSTSMSTAHTVWAHWTKGFTLGQSHYFALSRATRSVHQLPSNTTARHFPHTKRGGRLEYSNWGKGADVKQTNAWILFSYSCLAKAYRQFQFLHLSDRILLWAIIKTECRGRCSRYCPCSGFKYILKNILSRKPVWSLSRFFSTHLMKSYLCHNSNISKEKASND